MPSRLPATPSLRQAGEKARQALGKDLTQVGAMAVLAHLKEALGNQAEARSIMEASNALSKRELVTRLWLIKDHARRNDLPGMLNNIDIILRVSASAQENIFPLLSQALTERDTVSALIPILKQDPPWAAAYLYTAATSGQGVRNLAEIYAALDQEYSYGGEEISDLIVEALVAQKEFEAALAFARKLQPAAIANRQLVQDADFSKIEGITPFTWRFTSSANFDAARSVDTDQGSGLFVRSFGAGRDLIATQLIALPPGAYRFRNAVRLDQPGSSLELQWRLRCANDESLIGVFEPLSDEEIAWSVPPSCSHQWLELNADTGFSSNEASAFVGPVRLAPLER